jgi:hypothetical protein
MTLFYLPLEPYKERYTWQWSAPTTGWLERQWIRHGIDYLRVDGTQQEAPREIKSGCVLDAVGRSSFCFSQISRLLSLAEQGKITSSDCVLLDDFWTPGFSALPYAFSLLGIRPRIYAFLHAQSVDEFDFTYPMRQWMRHFEKGIGEYLTGIFVCSPTLKDLICWGGISTAEKVHVVGHPFCSEEVLERMPRRWVEFLASGDGYPRKHQVVWASRWDREKNPLFFLEVVRQVVHRDSSVKFVVCTGAKKIRSNDSECLRGLYSALVDLPGNLELREDLSKEQYYEILCGSKIQFNCASQDFNPITLQEASVAGCFPVYPYFRSFPTCLRRRQQFFYDHLDVDSAVNKIMCTLCRPTLWERSEIQERAWIHQQFDSSWQRMLKVMGLWGGAVEELPE